MQGQTADKTVLRIRVGWLPAVVAGAGLVVTVLGLTPAQATPPGGTGTHQSYVCRYVGKSLRLASGVNPALVDIASVQPHTFMDDPHNGHIYVLIANSGRLNPAPSITLCPGYTPPPTTTSSTTSTTTGPTVTPSGSSTTSSTTSPTTQPTVSTTSSPATSPTVTAKPVVHSTGDPKPAAATSHPSVSRSAANAVPLAATDGADLAGQPVQSPREGLLASGFLLMLAGGVLSIRRTNAQ
jgi:hypothetical protein